MLRRTHILTAAALLATCAVPAYANGMPDVPPPPSSIAASAGEAYDDLRSPDARDAGTVAKTEEYQDLRSPDARDAGRESPPVQQPIVEIREVPANGFDWGDAGIGAAGILAMVTIAAGLTLMVSGRRRRREVQVPAH
jgi:hypothetical protein